MEHFRNPRNVGEIENADGIGEVGNPVCGDMMTFYIKVDNNKLTDVKFKTFGCGAAIAVSSMVSEMAKGKTLEEALKITNQMVAQELGGLPSNKLHCSNLGADALHKAIENYLKKRGDELQKIKKPKKCLCPYCDEPLLPKSSFCQTCKVEVIYCKKCGEPIPKNSDKCPKCGTKR